MSKHSLLELVGNLIKLLRSRLHQNQFCLGWFQGNLLRSIEKKPVSSFQRKEMSEIAVFLCIIFLKNIFWMKTIYGGMVNICDNYVPQWWVGCLLTDGKVLPDKWNLKIMGISEILRRIWLFSANKIIALNLLVNNQLDLWSNSTHHYGT